LARFEGRTWWIRVQSPDGHEPAIRDVSEPEELAYALRTVCMGSLDWKAIKQLLGEQNALKQQKSHPEPLSPRRPSPSAARHPLALLGSDLLLDGVANERPIIVAPGIPHPGDPASDARR
jgi:hypothetical protein